MSLSGETQERAGSLHADLLLACVDVADRLDDDVTCMFMIQNKGLVIQPEGSSFYIISSLTNIFCLKAYAVFVHILIEFLLFHVVLYERFLFLVSFL